MTSPDVAAAVPRPELTVRAVVTGMLIGALLTPCNVYSGLKIGWSFNMSIAAGLLGFGWWRASQWAFGTRPWGLYENNINQTAASSSASIISGGLVAPIPALTMLTGQSLPWPYLMVWVFVVSILGVVVAAGLRNQMLVRDHLTFPAGVATAETIREIHSHGREAAQRLRVLILGAVAAGSVKLADAAFMLPRLAPPFAVQGASAANLGFVLDPSLLMVGFGTIIGLRAGLSLLLGAVLAWGILGPAVVARGWVPPGPADPVIAWFPNLVEWLLWPGVTLMVASALASFAIALGRSWLRRSVDAEPAAVPVLPRRAFLAGLAVTMAMAVAAQIGLFHIHLTEAVLAVLLSYVLAVVAARVSGETGITPIGAMGKITQLTFGVISPGNVVTNLMSANVTGGAAGQCADLLHDLRTGQLIGAQAFGVLAGSLVGSLVYLLLIPDPAAMLMTAEWPAPAVAVWKAVAEVMGRGVEAIPHGAVPAMILGGGAGLVLAIAENVLPPKFAKMLPSATSVGLAFVIPAWNSLSLALGAVAAALLARFAPEWTKRRLIAVAAGLVAGESLVGVAMAAASMFAFPGHG